MDRRRWIVSGAIALLAALGVAASLLVSNAESISSDYEALGRPLGKLAEATQLRADLVPRVRHGREFASAVARIESSRTNERLEVWLERVTVRNGKQRTVLVLSTSHQIATDLLKSPWQQTQLVRSEDFVLSPDFSRIELDTSVCDERTGETKDLHVRWTMKGQLVTRPAYGELASHHGDATAAVRFGDESFEADLASAGMQLVSRPAPGGLNGRDGRLMIDGKRRKAGRCR